MLTTAASTLARLLHHGQTDKAGRPYYDHLCRVAARVSTLDAITVAYFHDILEDTPMTAHDLEELGFATSIVREVETVTRRKDESYGEFIDRIACSEDDLAIEVKIADVRDHLADTSAISEEHQERYIKALDILLSK